MGLRAGAFSGVLVVSMAPRWGRKMDGMEWAKNGLIISNHGFIVLIIYNYIMVIIDGQSLWVYNQQQFDREWTTGMVWATQSHKPTMNWDGCKKDPKKS